MLTAADLAGMRTTQMAAMQDTCTLRKWAPTVDDYGTEIPAYTDTTDVDCGLDVTGGTGAASSGGRTARSRPSARRCACRWTMAPA